MYDLFSYAKTNNAPGMLLMIDFEKAFDSVDFRFLVASLELFGFGEHFVTWVKIILGCEEGTQFNLFILVMEVFALLLKKHLELNLTKQRRG